MKVCLISHSDIRGGASIAALRLLDALNHAGVDAKMIVKSAEDTPRRDITAIGGSPKDKLCFLSERTHIFISNGFDREQLFKVSTGECGLSIHNHPWIKDADIVVLNWFNQGMMSLDEISKIKKPLVWVMHDMWPLTGICHHSFGCKRYEDKCGCCHFLGKKSGPHDLSYKVLQKKLKLYDKVSIHFVAVSRWLGDMARNSTLLRKQNVTVIGNTFPANQYSVIPQKTREELGLPLESILIALCAARIDDAVKDFPLAIETLNIASERSRDKLAIVLCGEIRDRSVLNNLQMPYCELGVINDAEKLKDIYSHCSVLLSTAKYETFGLTLIEGLASGAIPVASGDDGREDIVDHKINGYLARPNDAEDLAEGIIWALKSNLSREFLRKSAVDKFSEQHIAAQYIELFNKILNK